MARRKRPAQLQQQLTYATARAAHVTPPKAAGTKPNPRPKEDITYKSYTEKVGGANALYTVVASKGAVAFFGDVGALGLTVFDAVNPRVPRYFKPAKIHATIGATDVQYVTAVASGRSYPKYTMHASTDNRQTNLSDEIKIMEPRQIGWNQILGNPYRYGLHPDMLRPEGYQYTGMVRVVGQKARDTPMPVTILFDSEYVSAYLRKYVLEKIVPTSYDEFQEVFTKAWQDWQES